MSRDVPIHEKAPTTDRSATELAIRYGYLGITDLCNSLPKNARILDVGAGASSLGRQIAIKRKDVEVVCFDFSYHDERILSDLERNKPENLHYIPGDIANLVEKYGRNSFDTVFSYWLLPHLALEDRNIAKVGISNLYSVTKYNGELHVGPTRRGTLNMLKRVDINENDLIDFAVDQITLSPIMRRFQILSNELTLSYFGISRYMKRENGRLYVYDPESETYIKVVSRRGVIVAEAFARHASALAMKKLQSVCRITQEKK